MIKFSKRMKKAKELYSFDEKYSLESSLDIIKKYEASAKAKFDETVDIVFKLGVDPRQSDQMVRGVVAMPNGLGKKINVAVITNSDRVLYAKDCGADISGSEDLIEEIVNGRLDFDIVIATPDMMPKMAKLGKVLGTKGLMPNPKLGTVNEDIKAAVNSAKSGQVEFRTEKAGLIHAGIGKLSFEVKALAENFMALHKAILGAKPTSSKGIYLQKIFLTTSHGPSIKLDLQKISV